MIQNLEKTLEKIKHDGSVALATAGSRTAVKWKNEEILWSDLVQHLSYTTRTHETYAEYLNMPKNEQGGIKDVGGFVGGTLKGGRRKADAVAWRQIVTLDADYVKGDIWDVIMMMFDYSGLIYSTHSHTAEKPRVRFVFPLSRAVTAEEYVAIAKKIAEDIGIDFFDDTTYQPHRLMYWPSTAKDGEYLFEMQDEKWLDPDDVLSRYVDWRDPLEWPESSRQKQVQQRMAAKQGDPHGKPGMVGAFCRTYSIEEAIETFLADEYTGFGSDRYTYNDGSTAGGLVLYEDGKFAYSHHGTDPVSSMLVNSFDLVRLHKFSALDDEAKAGTPISRMPSTLAMVKLAQEDNLVKRGLVQARLAEAEIDFGDDLLEPGKADKNWIDRLEINRNGEVVSNARNAELILSNAPFEGILAYDEFKNAEMIKGDLPWRKRDHPHKSYEPWNGADDKRLNHYVGKVYDFNSKNIIDNAYTEVTRKNSFHPVREYLESHTWDGIGRVESFFIDFLGAEDTPYARAVTRKWLAAAITRIYEPGCKFDYMPVLVGPQGFGKSSIIAKLAREWFSDSLTSVTGKEALEHLQSGWIFELAELSATKKNEAEEVKAFITKTTDIYRVAYDRVTSEFPRKCVFIGTTNRADFLRDQTGNRRFWPISVEPKNRKYEISDLTDGIVGQVWAEAVTLYKKGEKLYLDPSLEAEARKIQDSSMEEDPRAGLIESYLETLLPTDWDSMEIHVRRDFIAGTGGLTTVIGEVKREKVCAAEIWTEVLGNDLKTIKPYEARDICDILRKSGWTERQPSRSTFSIYGQQRTFIRE